MRILMCRPDYFDIKYKINPWMEQKIDKVLAANQWFNLKKEIEQFLKVKVEEIKPKRGLPDMVFTADSAIIYDNKAICANFKHQQRQKESLAFSKFLTKKKFKIFNLPKKYSFEGGDFLFYQNMIICGHGFRTDLKTHKLIGQIFNKKVVSLKLINPYLYHLDTALFPVKKQLLFYPQAFDGPSVKKILKINQAQIVNQKSAFTFGLNNLCVDKRIIANSLSNGCLDSLKNQGFEIKKLDVGEFIKSGGGIHCLACQLN